MNQTMKAAVLMVGIAVVATGCQFLGGAATGTAATGAGYELRAKQRMDRLDRSYKDGQIDQREYEIRKDEIQKGSIAY